jgi:FolB domain-containing protein
MDFIEIDNLRLRCVIGFSQHERKDRQDVVISLRIGTDMRKPGDTDKPDDAINYRTVTKAIIQHVETSSYFLVEKLAAEIARICVIEHGAPRPNDFA